MTAEQFLKTRFDALGRGDFAAVHGSYHAQAPFLQNFSDPAAYIEFAEQNLGEIDIASWKSLRQRTLAADRQEHLLVMELSAEGGSLFFYELALLIDTPAGWRYHSAQKLAQEDYSGPPEQIDFSHFDQVDQKIVY